MIDQRTPGIEPPPSLDEILSHPERIGRVDFTHRLVPEPAPEPGEVLVLDPVQINLEGGHYLRIGIALQMTNNVAHAPDGSKALDATIDLFSGLDMADLGKAKERHHLKEELLEHLEHEYHGDVMGVYFTEFVTQ